MIVGTRQGLIPFFQKLHVFVKGKCTDIRACFRLMSYFHLSLPWLSTYFPLHVFFFFFDFLDIFSQRVSYKGYELKSYPLFHWENSIYLILRSFKSMIFYHVPKETSNFWYFFQISFVMNHLFPETRSFQSKYFNKM